MNTISLKELIVEFNINPNPSSGKFHLEFKNIPYTGMMTLYNASGQKIYQFELINKKQVDLQLELEAGVYLLVAESRNEFSARKLIIN